MKDTMVRFLKSIHIENIDDFDMDFEMIGRDRFKKEQFNFVILKQTPWKYNLLEQFQAGLNTIAYPYSLRFSYIHRPRSEEVIELFKEWHQSIYHIPSPLLLEDEIGDVIKITYKNNEEKEQNKYIVKDFKDFLNFLSYEFVIFECIEQESKTIENVKEEKIEEIEIGNEVEQTFELTPEEIKVKEEAEMKARKVAEDELSSENDDFDPVDSSEISEEIQKERNELTSEVQDFFMDLMKQNKIQMEKERERARLNKRGSYVPIDKIDDITAMSDHVDFSGKVFKTEEKEFGGHKKITIGVHDECGGAIFVNSSISQAMETNVLPKLVRGANIRVRGVVYTDEFTKSLTIRGHYIDLLPPDDIQAEPYEMNRVELHLHSTFSAMDGVGSMQQYCEYAKALGHKAIAITDHAVVQGYPDAQQAAKSTGVKILYGCELYMVDDKLNYIKNPSNIPLNSAKLVLLDLETTGLSCYYNRIIEFGAVTVEKGTVTSSIDILINPECPIPDKISELTGINEEMVKDCPTIAEAMPKIIEYCKDAILITHNANFDISFLQETLKRLGYPIFNNPVIDTLALSRYLFPEAKRHSLGALCKNLDVFYDEESAHRADYDATVLNDAYQAMIATLSKTNPNITHADLGNLETPKSLLKHIHPFHVTVFAKNKAGLKDLYKIVSMSHVDYLSDVPKIPRREVEAHRENLIVGSACFNGEVFETARYYDKERLKEVMKFYDYIEVQPPENYSFLVNTEELTTDDVYTYINDIISCADELNKMVVATSDCHYVKKSDKVFRDVYINAKGIGGVNHPLNPYFRAKLAAFENPDQHYRTTKEMLEEFSFLSEEKAKEIVITNTNKIADMTEVLVPLPNDVLYTPEIENCENELKDMVYAKAHELYGDPLPELIEKRLKRELDGIIDNGYSVIYYIAHKIVKKSNEDGFIVGSRGSVGSSLVATMAGITEVNSLPPHYRCPKCKHIEWTSKAMPNYLSGYDLPDKVCPICGEPMVHDGQNIPFETFLGFNADKTPDIDLNFPGDYQARAHDYTKVLLGESNVFRAGTVGTVKDKTAFGFVKGYIERMGLDPNKFSKAKIEYLASGCVDVKRTTGQHPGGIVVIPKKYDVYDFTPIQYPADEPDSSWKTTHFDFTSMHDTILKLDMLGHVDPMALKMMCELAHMDIHDIPLNDDKVISLFSSPDALGMKKDYDQAKTGALGIPEFGTDFVRGILEDTRPKSFADLVIISGISHGTNVWQGNIETLIKEGTATLREVIGCRDDIMTYLISKGVESLTAFTIMEKVRKGKGVAPEFEEAMKNNNVPQYYIEACKKIQYLFPKGHAVAYVTMAVRVGYFKVYYPLVFYATFFSVRSDAYDIAPMIKGKDAVIDRLNELKVKSHTKGEKLSNKEDDQMKTLHVALEMLQRGYKFENIDIYKSDAKNFVIDEKNKALIPPFITIDGLGLSAAESILEARKEREFTSKKDLLSRTKLSSTNLEKLESLGSLDGLSDTDQLTLF